MRHHPKFCALLAALACWGGVGTTDARAGLLPVTATVTPDGGNFRWSYGVVLTTDNFIKPGDYFTIYDFAGFVPGSEVTPAGFTFSTAMVGPTPDRITPDDSPSVLNLTWTYNGPQITGQVGLGNFMALSTYGNSADGFFTARTHRDVDGRVDSNITDTPIPVPTAPPAVPEPATLLLLGIGLPLAGGARLLRRKRG